MANEVRTSSSKKNSSRRCSKIRQRSSIWPSPPAPASPRMKSPASSAPAAGMAPIVAGDQSYDVASDGRFVVIRNEADADGRVAPTLVLIQNWSEELTRLLPTN